MIAAVAVGAGVSFIAVALLIVTSVTDGFVFAIGVTVALVPEGLLPTVTLSLAIGAQRMAKRKAAPSGQIPAPHSDVGPWASPPPGRTVDL